ncbi:MAG TPA: DMT family transporter [Rhodanobacteraceae bacterium]|nr:DMT family transporter [Rhodanobacteraceae bacterium]
MALSAASKAQLQIHTCVLLWGFTAIVGKLITLAALPLVWWRMLIVVAALLTLPRVWRGLRALPARTVAGYAGVGVLVSLHWLTFYGAVKLANASVAATCIAIAPVFLALIEPWVARRRFAPMELLLGIGVVPGVALVVGGIPTGMRLGLVIGVVSAVFVALFSAFNKRMVEHADPLTATCIELGAGTLFLTLLAPWMPHAGPAFPLPSLHDALLLLVLAIGLTLLPFAMALTALRQVSAYAMQIATNLEPVYAIVFAILILGEQRQLDPLFYVGVAVVLATVIAHPLLSRRKRKLVLPPPEVLATAESKTWE